ETLAAISLKRTLAGYQIPTSKNKGIKRIGIVRYLLYTLPLVAILCAALALMSERNKKFDLFAFLIGLVVLISMSKQISALHKEGLFVKIQACKGFWFTLFSFLGITVAAFIKLLYARKGRHA
ncbi:MAG: hypothetical protein JSV93_00430, partial [Candidatus Omnitrophota bacterium]